MWGVKILNKLKINCHIAIFERMEEYLYDVLLPQTGISFGGWSWLYRAHSDSQHTYAVGVSILAGHQTRFESAADKSVAYQRQPLLFLSGCFERVETLSLNSELFFSITSLLHWVCFAWWDGKNSWNSYLNSVFFLNFPPNYMGVLGECA
jgi:hypothetical protein